jgi:hypothetical protein
MNSRPSSFIKRYQVPIFFLLAYAFSWLTQRIECQLHARPALGRVAHPAIFYRGYRPIHLAIPGFFAPHHCGKRVDHVDV